MFLPKSDVFKELRQEAINEISEIAVRENHDAGALLFSKGDPAKFFYILTQGSVKLTIGEKQPKDYMVNNHGDVFGWSSVVGNAGYTASAICAAPTEVLKIDRVHLEKVFDAHERSGRKFYMSVAKQLGQRLIDLHP